jgi:hypothetical protein
MRRAAVLACSGALLLPVAGDASAHSCKCRANGRDYEQGQMVCIRGQLARCEMALNNSSWKIISPTCPETELDGGGVRFSSAGITISSIMPEPDRAPQRRKIDSN